MNIGGFVLFLAGIFLAIWVKKNQFKRTNQYGVEEFSNMYGKALLPHIEKMLWYLAIACILWGAMLAFS